MTSAVAGLGFNFVGVVDHDTYNCFAANEADNKRLVDGPQSSVDPDGCHLQLFAAANSFGKEATALRTDVSQDGGAPRTLIGFAVRPPRRLGIHDDAVLSETPPAGAAATRFFTSWPDAEALLRTWCSTLEPVSRHARNNTLFFPTSDSDRPSVAPASLSAFVDTSKRRLDRASAAYIAASAPPSPGVGGGGARACGGSAGDVNPDDSGSGSSSSDGGLGDGGSGCSARSTANPVAESLQNTDIQAATADERARLTRVLSVAHRVRAKLVDLRPAADDTDGHVAPLSASDSDSDAEGGSESGYDDGVHLDDGLGAGADADHLSSTAAALPLVSPAHAHGAGGPAHLKRQAEAAVGAVRFLTAGQRTWDWFQCQRGHVTPSVATVLLSLATTVRQSDPASAALCRAMDSAPKRVANVWHAFDGDHETPACISTKAVCMDNLQRDGYVRSLFDAGLAESKQHRWLAASPGAIGAVHMNALVHHLSPTFGALVEPLGGLGSTVHVSFEFKTVFGGNTAKYEELTKEHSTEQGWMACSMGSRMFRALVPDIRDRHRLIHTVATLQLPAIVFVAATRASTPIVSKLLVVPDAAMVTRHVAVLEVLALELMDWMHVGPEARVPNWISVDTAQVLQSRQALWWATRMTVLENGPMHPVKTLQPAFAIIHNRCGGGWSLIPLEVSSA